MGGGNASLKCALCGKGEAKYVLVASALSEDYLTPVCDACLEGVRLLVERGLVECIPLEPTAIGRLIEIANMVWSNYQLCLWLYSRCEERARSKRFQRGEGVKR